MSHPLRRAMAEGRPVLAVNPGGVALPVVDVVARHGADCLFIDCERTAISVDAVPMLARAAKAAGMASLVRCESADAAILLRYLDCGVDGLIVPQVEDPAICDRMEAVARQFTKGKLESVFLVAQIENVAGREKLQEIAGHPAIDCILIGPNDLAHSMGFSGDTTRSELQTAVREIAADVVALGKPFGLPVTTQSAGDWVGRGARLLYTTLDQFVGPSMRDLRSAIG
jgi:4-hydroxy-2-oxoheptanedioate aldolase